MNFKCIFPLAGVAAGILAADTLFEGIFFPAVIIGCSILVWLFISYVSKDPQKALKFSSLHNIWILLLFMGIGSFDYDQMSRPNISGEINDRKCLIKGRIDDVKYLSEGDRFKLNVLSIKTSSGENIPQRNLNVLVSTDGFIAEKGDLISFETTLSPIKDLSYAHRLKHRGIFYQCKVKSTEIKKTGEASSFSLFFHHLRQKLISEIENSSLQRPTSDFLISFILGEKSLLPQPSKTILSSAGMAHILALSGMHVAIILSILVALLFPLSLLGYPKTGRIIAILLIWVYVVLTGSSPSTVRAAIMASFLAGAILLERKNIALNALMMATLLILLLNPLNLWDIGLQLSFLCVASILIFKEKLNPVDHHAHPHLYKFTDAVLITLICTLSTWMLIAYYFGNIPLMFLPSNVILLPLLPLFTAFALIYIFLLSIGIDAFFIAKFLDFFHNIFLLSADTLSLSGNANLNINVPGVSVALWIAALVCAAIFIHTQKIFAKKFNIFSGSLLLILSVTFIFFNEEASAQNIKFLHSFTKTEVHHSRQQATLKYSFPRRSISKLNTSDFDIIFIDRKINNNSLHQIKEFFNNLTPNFLLIGSNADINQIAEILKEKENMTISKLVLHSGVGKNKKTELLRLLDEKHWDKIYSLRDNGSLVFDL